MSETATEREALLKRWSELAPGECVFISARALSVGVELHALSLPLTRSEEGVLLLALIEALRARGWHYTLKSREIYSWYNESPGAVHVGVITAPTNRASEASEPCDALLSTYVQALEATEKR